MTPTAGTLGPANELDDARWVPLQEAPMLLTYDHDRRRLEGRGAWATSARRMTHLTPSNEASTK